MQSTKRTTTERPPRPVQVLQPNKICRCGACEPPRPKLPEGTRRLKVYGRYADGHKQVPVILLQAQWLRSSGFDIGDEILATLNNRQLVISFEKR